MLRLAFRSLRATKDVFSSTLAKAYLSARGVKYGKGLRVWSFPYCRCCGDGSIVLGDDVTIRNKIHENEAGCFYPSVFVALPGAKLRVGNNVGISSSVLYCATEITIEDHVGLGAGVRIYDTDFHPLHARDRRIHDESKIRKAPVRICVDAWIGAYSTILKGVTVGARSVVGAGSVVTKDVPPDTIVAGSPARIIRRIDSSESDLSVLSAQSSLEE